VITINIQKSIDELILFFKNYIEHNKIDYEMLIDLISKTMKIFPKWEGQKYNNELANLFLIKFNEIVKKYNLNRFEQIQVLCEILLLFTKILKE
jgi:hypothetical protein